MVKEKQRLNENGNVVLEMVCEDCGHVFKGKLCCIRYAYGSTSNVPCPKCNKNGEIKVVETQEAILIELTSKLARLSEMLNAIYNNEPYKVTVNCSCDPVVIQWEDLSKPSQDIFRSALLTEIKATKVDIKNLAAKL